jgi:hypothetical protein
MRNALRFPDLTINPLAAAAMSQKETTYFAALGRMIAAYAKAEASVHMLARHLSGLPELKARVIFSSMRLPDLTDRIRQMMRLDAMPADTCQDVEACLVQLDAIASQRGKLVHRMIEYAGEGLTVSNIWTAKSLLAIERNTLSARDLQQMTTDLGAIFLRLLAVITPHMPLNQDAEIREMTRAPWRYKPSPGALPKNQRRKTTAPPAGA